MSEELIYQCKKSLVESFNSYDDLTIHHVSYNEFEKQSIEFIDWCERTSKIITDISTDVLTCYLRQKSYEDFYEQGLIRLRTFKQYSNKLIERFPDLKFVIKTKNEFIYRIWNELERCFINYLDEDFDRIVQELHHELFVFEKWINQIEEQLERLHIENFEDLIKLQEKIKSQNSHVSSMIEICERLKNDYSQQIESIPLDYAIDLENRWHQIWIYSVEIQCKFEHSIFEEEDDDIIPFHSSDYEKISLTSSIHSEINRKRTRSPELFEMSKSKRRLSLNILPNLSPSIEYYSLTNIHDYEEDIRMKKTCSKLDIGYASEDELDAMPIFFVKKSQSDSKLNEKICSNLFSSLTHSLPLFEYNQIWRHSITSAYETCSNPDIDLNLNKRKKRTRLKSSLLMYKKKYCQILSNSYDASVEYTDNDDEQSDNDLNFTSSSMNTYQKSQSFVYNRYTTNTTTTGYSSDIEHETTTIPSDIDEQRLVINETIESSEPCWDGYQNPLFYPLNCQDIDSIETTLKWDDQFFEMNQSTSDDDEFYHHLRKYNASLFQYAYDSDSDFDDFNYVINQTEKQFLKTKHCLEKKKGKYDEFFRTCQTNIQCLEQIQTNLHRSNNSRLNNIQALESLQSYLSNWRAMQEQIEIERTRARYFSRLAHDLIELKDRLDQELSSWKFDSFSMNHYFSLDDFKRKLLDEYQIDKIYREKLKNFSNDIHQIEGHYREYQIMYSNGPFTLNIDEYLHSHRLILEQLTTKMNSYEIDFQTLLTTIDKLLPIENEIEQKFTSFDYHELQILIDKYEQLNFKTNLSSSMKIHWQNKLNFYRTMFNDFQRKHNKHVSFHSLKNINNNNNNNNSTTIRSSSNTSTLQEQTTNLNEIRDRQEISSSKQSTTSYISDDCKVYYIETVIEVDKPIFYERTSEITSILNTQNLPTTTTTTTNQKKFPSFDMSTNGDHHAIDSSDDDQISTPVKSSEHHQIDSGIELDPNSSSTSTIYNQRTSKPSRLLFPSIPVDQQQTSEPSLLRRVQQQMELTDDDFTRLPVMIRSRPRSTMKIDYRRQCFRSFLVGFFILLIVFLIFLSSLDLCSRKALFQHWFDLFVTFENDAMPTI